MQPHEDLSLNNRKGEKWKDVVGYEGYYQVSNLGRVKSLDRIVPHPRLHSQTIIGKILKQKTVKDINKHKSDAMISMQVALSVDGKTYYKNVRRLVYIAFVKQLNYDKDGLYVINKDGNGYNNRLSNLIVVTKSQKQQRSIRTGRQSFEYLKQVDRSKWKKNYSRRKPINQYSLRGRLIRKYKSIEYAHKITGFDHKGISNAAKGLYNGIWRGFLWKFPV